MDFEEGDIGLAGGCFGRGVCVPVPEKNGLGLGHPFLSLNWSDVCKDGFSTKKRSVSIVREFVSQSDTAISPLKIFLEPILT